MSIEERLEKLEQMRNDSDMQIYGLTDDLAALKARILVLENRLVSSAEIAARAHVDGIYSQPAQPD